MQASTNPQGEQSTAPVPPPHPPDVVDQLVKIPGFMRAKRWNNGARLLERWLTSPANSNINAGIPDTSTIKMDAWALTFPRAKLVYDQMVRERVWINTAAKDRIIRLIKAKGLLRPAGTVFGNLNALPPSIHDIHVNVRPVSLGIVAKLSDPLDDMFAALAAFEIVCSIEATITPVPVGKPPKMTHRVDIQRVGFYIRDDFNVNGSETLGYWNFTTGDISKTPFPGYDEVTDDTFRNYRTRFSKGGDFWVYSDIKILPLNPPQTFTIEE